MGIQCTRTTQRVRAFRTKAHSSDCPSEPSTLMETQPPFEEEEERTKAEEAARQRRLVREQKQQAPPLPCSPVSTQPRVHVEGKYIPDECDAVSCCPCWKAPYPPVANFVGEHPGRYAAKCYKPPCPPSRRVCPLCPCFPCRRWDDSVPQASCDLVQHMRSEELMDVHCLQVRQGGVVVSASGSHGTMVDFTLPHGRRMGALTCDELAEIEIRHCAYAADDMRCFAAASSWQHFMPEFAGEPASGGTRGIVFEVNTTTRQVARLLDPSMAIHPAHELSVESVSISPDQQSLFLCGSFLPRAAAPPPCQPRVIPCQCGTVRHTPLHHPVAADATCQSPIVVVFDIGSPLATPTAGEILHAMFVPAPTALDQLEEGMFDPGMAMGTLGSGSLKLRPAAVSRMSSLARTRGLNPPVSTGDITAHVARRRSSSSYVPPRLFQRNVIEEATPRDQTTDEVPVENPVRKESPVSKDDVIPRGRLIDPNEEPPSDRVGGIPSIFRFGHATRCVIDATSSSLYLAGCTYSTPSPPPPVPPSCCELCINSLVRCCTQSTEEEADPSRPVESDHEQRIDPGAPAIFQFDITRWRWLRTLQPRGDHEGTIEDIQLSTDGAMIYGAGVHGVVFEIVAATGSSSREFRQPDYTGAFRCLRLSQDQQSVFAGADQGTVYEFDIARKRHNRTYRGGSTGCVSALATSEDGKQLFAGLAMSETFECTVLHFDLVRARDQDARASRLAKEELDAAGHAIQTAAT